ncbi:MAG: hypothetical protein K8R59_05115 [Thermoanaerobaculales bacterium]|nr:hypothetical protein [Thermoanaerobaculales bacterium]
MINIDAGDVVVVHCREPREKVWGVLLRLDQIGVGVRGMDLGSVEDWLSQEAKDKERLLGPSTFFIPMHRVHRIDLDESTGAVVSIADRYRSACGQSVDVGLGVNEADRSQ